MSRSPIDDLRVGSWLVTPSLNSISGTDGAIDRCHCDAKSLELSTSPLQAQRPRAKMHAIVREDSIAALAQTRARSFHHCEAIKAFRFMSHSDLMAARETFERNLFHWPAPQSVRKTGVMNDTAVADVNTVVAVERTWGDKMRRERGLLAGAQQGIAREEVLLTVGAACIVCSRDAGLVLLLFHAGACC